MTVPSKPHIFLTFESTSFSIHYQDIIGHQLEIFIVMLENSVVSWEFQAQTHLLANSAASSTDINYLSPEVLKKYFK